MTAFTITERQLQALYGLVQMEASIGGVFSLADGGELTSKEMRDLHRRFALALEPQPEPAPVTVAIK